MAGAAAAAAVAGIRLVAAANAIAVSVAKTKSSPSFPSSSHQGVTCSFSKSFSRILRPSSLYPSSPRHRLFTFSGSYPAPASSDDAYCKEEPQERLLGGEEREQNPRSSSRDAGRLYVGNLPYTTTSSELAELFSQAGAVDTVEIIYDRVTDRSRGFGFVTMASVEEANEAIRLFDGSLVGGRTVKVNFPEVPKGGEREVMGPRIKATARRYVDSSHKIYAGNLGWTVTSEALKNAFAAFSGLLGAKVVYERDSGRSRGFGFVTFASDEECQGALESMDGKMLAGRPLRLNLASDRASSVVSSSSLESSLV
ncbi:33 kDa ribonucleoprotein, chloroplastic [Apostasia shenzhenica]|uniref:33 kDa ribonucleoprotein, chloroplastic n=1 Tax=Apostasia shenzhenica TaxID=1088818 RepID=A0A2I0BE18_9ASPA|nr:33 kDa ribonucleoprotein, chloroplastic [Apostasia shenzhenica]